MMWQIDWVVATSVSSAAAVADGVTITNDINVFNSNFYPDLSRVL